MKSAFKHILVSASGLVGIVLWLNAPRAADPPVSPGPLVIVDSAGKEQKLTTWKFVAGTRPLGWLEAPGGEAPDKDSRGKKAGGPEALEFRDDQSTNFEDGILTLVPLDRLRSLDFDNDKRTALARVVMTDKEDGDERLSGTTRYLGSNQVTIEAEVDRGEQGIAAVKYPGGVAKGIQSIRFPPPKAPPAPVQGRTAAITVDDKDTKNIQKVVDLQALYRGGDGSERLSPTLLFKKTLKIDIAKVQKLKAVEGRATDGREMQVTQKDGTEETLTLLKTATIDGKQVVLEGLLGRVPVGFKLFPVHTVAAIEFEEAKDEAKPEKPTETP
jgi:hypothetical protein